MRINPNSDFTSYTDFYRLATGKPGHGRTTILAALDRWGVPHDPRAKGSAAVEKKHLAQAQACWQREQDAKAARKRKQKQVPMAIPAAPGTRKSNGAAAHDNAVNALALHALRDSIHANVANVVNIQTRIVEINAKLDRLLALWEPK